MNDQVKEDEIGRACGTRVREDEFIDTILVVEIQGQIQLGGPKRRWGK
jgi:hypothetical protein